MKKCIVWVLVLLTLCLGLAACQDGGKGEESVLSNRQTGSRQEEPPTVTVLVDLHHSDIMTDTVTELLYTTPGCGTEFLLATETLPYILGADEERDAALTRAKTEIMAGRGADLYLCENPTVSTNTGSAVFPFPQKAMKNHLLLPLDEYIEQAERMEWDKLLPQVMEAGRGEEGQCILPMTYSFPLTAYNKEEFTLTAQLPMTWDEMLESDDPMVVYAAGAGFLRELFGEAADGERDTMLLSEEDILRRMEQRDTLGQELSSGEYDSFRSEDPLRQRGSVVLYRLGNKNSPSLQSGTDFWLVPCYNAQGGVTATIGAFAAINRNTQEPAFSFRLLETLFTASGQRSELFAQLNGQPVHMDVPCNGWTASQWNDQQLAALQEQIGPTVFRTPVEWEFDQFILEPEDGDREGWVHDHYVRMQMMLAES